MADQVVWMDWDKPLGISCREGALTIGNFDGVHLGHQTLLQELNNQAKQVSGPAVVLTFDPHPLQLLRPKEFPPLLTEVPRRAQLLRKHGADFVLILRTNRELLQLRARDFFDRVIQDKLQPKTIVPGFNFGFGRNREGTVETLEDYCREAGIGFVLVAPMEQGGKTVSSSRIRGLLEQGDVRAATGLLGRPHWFTGIVETGQKRGQTIGFPTANLGCIQTQIPGNGVYAVRVVHQGESWAGAANIGPNPTFGENSRKVEVHVIDFSGDLYGKELDVQFIERLRDTKPFSGIEELVRQLKEDVEKAKILCKRDLMDGPSC